MKSLLLIAVTILAVGCGGKDESTTETKPVEEKEQEVKEEVKPEEPVAETKPELEGVNPDELDRRADKGVNQDEFDNGENPNFTIFIKGSDTPYTGKVFGLYENGQKMSEFLFKDGKRDGLSIGWHENGQKLGEVNFKDNEFVVGSEKYFNSKGEPVDSEEEARK